MPQPRAVPRAAMALAALSGDEHGNPFGDEGLTALLAPPPPPAGALSPPTRTGVLTKLKGGAPPRLQNTQITDAGCATLAAALDSGALPVLEDLHIPGTPASAAAKFAVKEALERTASRAAMPS
jgi:hypothetical protein